MYYMILFSVLLFQGPQEKPAQVPEKVKRALDRADEQRLAAIAESDRQIKRYSQELARPSKDTTRQQIQSMRTGLANQKNKLESLKMNDPPYVPELYPDQLKTEQIGRFVYPSNTATVAGESVIFKVTQVLSPNEMLAEGFGQLIWFSGISTVDVTDGKKISYETPFEVVGTRTYDTALGGTKTVFVVQPFDMQPYLVKPEKDSTKKKSR